MTRTIVGAAVLLVICAGSAIAYARDHRRRRYAEREAQRGSVRAFRGVYGWLRLSTPVAGLGALIDGSGAWLTLRPRDALFALGVFCALAGFALFVHSKRVLGREYAPCYDARMPARIVVEGAYRCIRHPIYTANLLTMGGLTVMVGSAWLALNTVLLALFCFVSARREEDALWASSPVYRGYVLDTGRFLPRIRRAG